MDEPDFLTELRAKADEEVDETPPDDMPITRELLKALKELDASAFSTTDAVIAALLIPVMKAIGQLEQRITDLEADN